MRIVKSPERLKKGIEEMSKQQGELKNELKDYSRKSRELSTRLDVMSALELVSQHVSCGAYLRKRLKLSRHVSAFTPPNRTSRD